MLVTINYHKNTEKPRHIKIPHPIHTKKLPPLPLNEQKTLTQIQQDSTRIIARIQQKNIRVIREICGFKAKPQITTNSHK